MESVQRARHSLFDMYVIGGMGRERGRKGGREGEKEGFNL